jgi:hypothetical protein
MTFKKKATGAGIFATILLVIGGLATLGLMNMMKGCEGGNVGLGHSGLTDGSAGGQKSKSGAGELIITVEGEQYVIDGVVKPMDQVISLAIEASRDQSSQSEARVLVKRKNARYMTVQTLEGELKRRSIRYRTEDAFR